eukprot:8114989-Ditylum_brightwellii.AAC.1
MSEGPPKKRSSLRRELGSLSTSNNAAGRKYEMERRTHDVENKVLPFNLRSKKTAAEVLLCYACDEGKILSVEEREESSEESS